MNKKRLSLLLIFLFTININAGQLVKQVREQLAGNEQLFKGVIGEKAQQRQELEEEKSELLLKERETSKEIETAIEEVKTQQSIVERDLARFPDEAFLKQKRSLLNELYQAYKDQQRARELLISVIDDLIKELDVYLKDPDFNEYKKEHKLREGLYYSFQDLQELHERIQVQERRVAQLKEQEASARSELDNRKTSAQATKENYEQKKKELEKRLKVVSQETGAQAAQEAQETRELLTLEQRLYETKKERDTLRLREIELKISLLEMRSFIVKSQRDILTAYVRKIKPAIRVSEADLMQAQENLNKEKSEYYRTKEKYRQERERLTQLEKQREKEVSQLSKIYGVALTSDVVDWAKEPKQTIKSYLEQYQLATFNTHRSLLDKKRELIDAQIAFEDEKFFYEETQYKVKESYNKKSLKKFLTEDDITKEVKRYDAPKAELQANLSRYKEKTAIVTEQLSKLKKSIDNIHEQREQLTKVKNTVFQNNPREYAKALELLNRAESYTKEEIDLLGKLTGIYSSITTTVMQTLHTIGFITAELGAITIWHRSEGAITWQGIKNIVPELTVFFSDVRGYLLSIHFSTVLKSIVDFFKDPWQLLSFITLLLLFLVAIYFGRKYFPRGKERLLISYEKHTGFVRFLCALGAIVFDFVSRYIALISLWFFVFINLRLFFDLNPFVYILFYLGSIPYFLYLANRFINMLWEYIDKILFFFPFLQHRFVIVFAIFLYSTITVWFFREAFVLGDYYRSELPNILEALLWIIAQISVILLLAKELVLIAFSGKWWHTFIEKYYYLLLLLTITVTTMSNPYVGFGKLVYFVFKSVLFTGFLLFGLTKVYGLFKSGVSRIFFIHKEDVVRERFRNAKTWFGLVIIATFMVLGFLGTIVIAKIWGWQISFKDVTEWMHTPLIGEEGARDAITFNALLQIIIFVLAGFTVAYLINKFVLDKIFDLLLVESGVQHTVTSITRYVVVVMMIFIGFKNVGLGALVGWIFGALALSIGWVLKEPIGDFAAYFIILVQRPVKIGDFIQIDEQTSGVVRKITPRSVIIRHKNSTTMVIPNIHIITKIITNWNFVHNFVAFNDITITIDFSEDPIKVKEVLLSVVEHHPNVLRNPQPIVRLNGFGEFGYDFMMRGFVSSAYTLDMWDIESDIRIQVVQKLHENNIKLALPVRILTTPDNKPDVDLKVKS